MIWINVLKALSDSVIFYLSKLLCLSENLSFLL